MKKLFKKFAGLMMGLLAVAGLAGIGANSNEAPVKAEAIEQGKCVLKLSSSYWGQASAYYTIHYWGGDTSTSWPGEKFNGGSSAKGNVEITANYDVTSTHCIIVRWGNSGCTTEWNRWSYFDGNAMTTKYNYFTNTAWDSCSSKYVEPEVPVETYTVTYYDGDKKLDETSGLSTFSGIDLNAINAIPGGKMYEGWYLEPTFTTKISSGTKLTSNISVYVNWKEISWSVIGTPDWDTDTNLEYNSETKRHEVKMVLKANDVFKIRLDKSWDTSLDYSRVVANMTNYLASDGTNDKNIKVLQDGYYLIYVNDGKVWDTADACIGVEKMEAEVYTVTFHHYDGTTSVNDVIENSLFEPEYLKQEGKRLVGWYTDENLENELVKHTPITSNLDLYPKYIDTKAFTIYVYDENGIFGETAYAYIWRDLTDGEENAAWPGVPMQKVEGTDNYYSLNITDPSASHDTLIVNGGKEARKSVELLLTYDSASVYTISTSETGELPAETKTVTAAITADGVESTGYYVKDSKGNLELANYVTTEQKQIAFERYMANVDTCRSYQNANEYRILATGLETTKYIDDQDYDWNDNDSDEDRDELVDVSITIEEKLTYMESLNNGDKNISKPLSSNLLSSITFSNNILIVLVVGLLGLTTVGAYYLLNKKKYAK